LEKIKKILTNEKGLFLALDQGLEHGPKDFNLKNINPDYVLQIAEKGKYNAIILQKGLAEKYYQDYKTKIPLILKLNGRTRMQDELYSPQICSVKNALKLGASAIGYTLYFGSPYETKMIQEFSKIQEEAKSCGLPVVLWAYPRGNKINEMNTETLAYAARASLELGADIIKIKYNHKPEQYKWVVKSAGKSKLFIAGGEKTTPLNVLKETYEVMKVGASGIAIGRNIWQHEEPLKLTKAIKSIIFDNKNINEAVNFL